MSKLIDTHQYHIWTDALHARALARQTGNEWDRGSYARWTVTSAWIAFETSCEDALSTKGLGNRFKDNVDECIERLALAPLDWGSGIWQKVLKVYKDRKAIVHVGSRQKLLSVSLEAAEQSIPIMREAIKAIYSHVGKPPPSWPLDDDDAGWSTNNGRASATLIRKGASEDDPQRIEIRYESYGKEYISDVLTGGTDYLRFVAELRTGLRCAVDCIRVYQKGRVIYEEKLEIRGV